MKRSAVPASRPAGACSRSPAVSPAVIANAGIAATKNASPEISSGKAAPELVHNGNAIIGASRLAT